ncbi:MAG: AAA family ATPase [Hyphomicrobiaceae bacterium]
MTAIPPLIVTLASSKGGVGKSTTAASLAGAYAAAGHKVHIVDLDGNHTVSRWLGSDGKITVSQADPQDLTEHLGQIQKHTNPSITLIDIAGTYERALTVAIARAHLTSFQLDLRKRICSKRRASPVTFDRFSPPSTANPCTGCC